MLLQEFFLYLIPNANYGVFSNVYLIHLLMVHFLMDFHIIYTASFSIFSLFFFFVLIIG